MVAMSIWFILETMTLKSGTQKIFNHEIFSILTILMLLTSTAGAVLATILNKRLASSRTASVTLSLATCQFILAISVLHLVELAWYAYVAQASGIGINQYSTGIWLTWSNSGGLGLSLTSGLLVTFFFISLSLGCLFTGMRTSHRPAFKILYADVLPFGGGKGVEFFQYASEQLLQVDGGERTFCIRRLGACQ